MKISHLKPGTKLMWDAPPNEWIDPKERILYPATIGERHYYQQMVKVYTGSCSSWMGPREQYLRYPTEEELEKYVWPDPK